SRFSSSHSNGSNQGSEEGRRTQEGQGLQGSEEGPQAGCPQAKGRQEEDSEEVGQEGSEESEVTACFHHHFAINVIPSSFSVYNTRERLSLPTRLN
ncbi:hypothetical protein PFISCL1PPCAC_20057, partial [Pristionchus fissidentatus]